MRDILFRAKRINSEEYDGTWIEGIPIKNQIGLFMCFDENPHYCSKYGYMEIDGTIEECRKAREKEEAKELKVYGECEDAKLICPSCGEDLYDLIDCGFSNCPYCGQAIE